MLDLNQIAFQTPDLAQMATPPSHKNEVENEIVGSKPHWVSQNVKEFISN